MTLAAIALILASPLLSVIAIAIKFDSPGPVIFRQRRIGRYGVPFTVLKFRTMTVRAPLDPHRSYIRALVDGRAGTASGDIMNKLTDDPRITRLGALLRRLSLDELPQLLNVLRGEMALVGPRPALDYELQYYAAEHYARFLVRPGLTGLWQVSGRARLNFHEMLDLDVEYVQTRSLHEDFRIMLRTPAAMVASTA